MSQPSLTVLDTQILTQLRTFARSESFLPRLVQTFEDHGHKSLAELSLALDREDRSELSAIAHRLKGSCLNLGAKAMADKLQQLEARYRPALSMQETRELLEEVKVLFDLSCKSLKELTHS